MKYKLLLMISAFLLSLICSCATVPPEFLVSMEKEKDGIDLLKERHKQTVLELTDNWYNERLERLMFIKKLEIDKITITTNDQNSNSIEVIKKPELEKIEQQFSEAIVMANKIRNVLILGYSDIDNWDKLVKIHNINLEMTQSLLELDKAQRKFYSELVGKNIPYPSDLINEQTKKLLNESEK